MPWCFTARQVQTKSVQWTTGMSSSYEVMIEKDKQRMKKVFTGNAARVNIRYLKYMVCKRKCRKKESQQGQPSCACETKCAVRKIIYDCKIMACPEANTTGNAHQQCKEIHGNCTSSKHPAFQAYSTMLI